MATNFLQASNSPEPCVSESEKNRRATQGKAPAVLADIYQEDVNIAIWQRELSAALQCSVSDFLQSNPTFQTSITVTPQSAFSSVRQALSATTADSVVLSENIAELVSMFADLFGLQRVGLRLSVLHHAMCLKFHVDRVPCRLITTYQGVATEWLPHESVDRTKLGLGSYGQPDNQSGLFQRDCDIQQLATGDVALLKGELWEGNENAGLVHRSPALPDKASRLLLTLDFSN